MAFVGTVLFPLLTFLTVSAYPTFYMVRNLPQLYHNGNVPMASLPRPKRAFDRLDASPFEFDSVSKRFDDDNGLLFAVPFEDPFASSVPSSPFVLEATFPKRPFGRSENNAFFDQKRKRTFGPLNSLRDNK